MGIFDRRRGEDDSFTPDCRVDEPSSTDGRTVMICRPKDRTADGRVVAGDRDLKIIIDGKELRTVDDGGVPEKLLKKTYKYLAEGGR